MYSILSGWINTRNRSRSSFVYLYKVVKNEGLQEKGVKEMFSLIVILKINMYYKLRLGSLLFVVIYIGIVPIPTEASTQYSAHDLSKALLPIAWAGVNVGWPHNSLYLVQPAYKEGGLRGVNQGI